MPPERIISKGNWYEARIMTTLQTYNIFVEKLKETPEATIEMDLYCRDVGMLLTLLNEAGEQLSILRKEKKSDLIIRR